MPNEKQIERWVKQAEAIDAKVRQKYASEIRELQEQLASSLASRDELAADVRAVCNELRAHGQSPVALAIEQSLDLVLRKHYY